MKKHGLILSVVVAAAAVAYIRLWPESRDSQDEVSVEALEAEIDDAYGTVRDLDDSISAAVVNAAECEEGWEAARDAVRRIESVMAPKQLVFRVLKDACAGGRAAVIGGRTITPAQIPETLQEMAREITPVIEKHKLACELVTAKRENRELALRKLDEYKRRRTIYLCKIEKQRAQLERVDIKALDKGTLDKLEIIVATLEDSGQKLARAESMLDFEIEESRPESVPALPEYKSEDILAYMDSALGNAQ